MPKQPVKSKDVWHEAYRLAPISTPIRAFLGMVNRSEGLPALKAGQSPPLEHLTRLVADVQARLPPRMEEVGYSEALRRLVDREFLKGARHRAQHQRANRVGASPEILQFERAFIAKFNKLGIPMFAHSVVRDASEQTRLYVTGRSLAKAGKSPHNHGFAVDLIHGVHAWQIPRAAWDIVGHVGLEVAYQCGLKLTWGGKWESFYDPAHWELSDWRSRVTVANGPMLDERNPPWLVALLGGDKGAGPAS